MKPFFVLVLLTISCASAEAKQPYVSLMESATKKHADGKLDSAIEDMAQAASYTPNPYQKAKILLMLADFLREARNPNGAKSVYMEILAGESRSYDEAALYGIVRACLEAGDSAKSQTAYKDLSTKYPDGEMIKHLEDNFISFPGSETETKFEPSKEEQVVKLFQEMPLPAIEQTKVHTPPEPLEIKRERTAKEPGETISHPQDRWLVYAGGWHSGVGGYINARDLNLDLFNNADFDKQIQPNFHVGYIFNDKYRIKLFYDRFGHQGNLRQNVTFDKIVYTSGASVGLKSHRLEGEFAYSLDRQANSEWNLLCGYTYFSDRLTLRNGVGKGAAAWERKYWVPFIGFGGRNRLSSIVCFDGSIRFLGMTSGNGKARGYSFDLDLEFGRDSAKSTSAMELCGTIGYRHFYINGETGQDSDYIRYSGPTFGLVSKF